MNTPTTADRRRIQFITENLAPVVARSLGADALIRYAAETAAAQSEQGAFDQPYALDECDTIVRSILTDDPDLTTITATGVQQRISVRDTQCGFLIAAAEDCMRAGDRMKARQHIHAAAQINPDAPAGRRTVAQLDHALA